MENNRSLAVSTLVNQELKSKVMLGVLGEHIPDEIFKVKTDIQRRDRVFTHQNTLETMLLSATLEDKSLKNAVNQFYIVHQKKREILKQTLKQETEKQKEAYKDKTKQKGRPRKFDTKIPKSKEADISLNTAAYSNARKRLPIELTKSLFESTKITNFKNNYSHWYGLTVAITDGTYLQLQDTAEIQKDFPVQKHSGSYPQALLAAIILRGTGQLFNYKLGSRSVSELALFNELIDDIPENYILIMDDLYNSYEIMNINVLRSKTPEMLKKELNVSLSAYNIFRKIIYANLNDLLFPPQEDFIYEFYTLNKDILIDKKGRVYSKWSTGRKRTKTTNP